MDKREKVIKGLKCCINGERTEPDCEHCPYSEIDGTCTTLHKLHADVLALLKAQEQEPIAPIRRSAHAQGADDVWYVCGKCYALLGDNPDKIQFCANCGREVKWG